MLNYNNVFMLNYINLISFCMDSLSTFSSIRLLRNVNIPFTMESYLSMFTICSNPEVLGALILRVREVLLY